MKKKNKNLIKWIGLVSFSLILIPISNINAADKYFYTTEELSGERIEKGSNNGAGYDTKLACEEWVKQIDKSHNPSSCYPGGEAKIKNVTPSTSKVNDNIIINGENLNYIESVIIGGKDAKYSNQSMTNQISLNVPSGATSGLIQIKTKYRGIATYSGFIIKNNVDTYWWYLNTSQEFYGAKGRLSTPGFSNEKTCNEARLAYEKSSSQAKTTGPCFQDTETNILKDRESLYNIEAQQEKGSIGSNEYNLLAPIGDIEKVDSMTISDYFSKMLLILIGLCGVLAVIMIVIGGIQWMGSESIFGKTNGKSKISKAILGLIIALGSYALLNTINPDLLGGKGLTIKQISVKIDDETEKEPWEDYSVGDNTKLCPQGFGTITVPWGVSPKDKLNVCNLIKDDVVNLLNDAKKENILLSGSGSRSTLEQQSLRVKHGCPDPKTKSSKCTPPTARPGHSMHESGLAIDFRCNNQKMTSSDECYKWLKTNASKYGLKNLASEPWHWSTTGQ